MTLTGRGVLSAQGGDGRDRLTGALSPSTWAHGGGGGGGGRIKVSASASLCDTGTKNVDGGASGVSDAMTDAQATDGATGTVDTSVTSCNRPGQTLTAFSPARVWVGLKNSDFAGLRLDLRAEVFVNYDTNPPVANGQVNNVRGGSSGFNNAVLSMIPLALTGGPVTFPESDPLMLRISVRRTCSGGGHNSGTVRLWYGGQPIDSAASRDAGSRFDATIDGTTSDYFLRTGFAISSTAGTSKTSIDAVVNSTSPCPNRRSRRSAPGALRRNVCAHRATVRELHHLGIRLGPTEPGAEKARSLSRSHPRRATRPGRQVRRRGRRRGGAAPRA